MPVTGMRRKNSCDEILTENFCSRPAKCSLRCGIEVGDAGVLIRPKDAIQSGIDKSFATRFTLLECFQGLAKFLFWRRRHGLPRTIKTTTYIASAKWSC